MLAQVAAGISPHIHVPALTRFHHSCIYHGRDEILAGIMTYMFTVQDSD